MQPEDRGTAAALLLALDEVLRRDPLAILTVLPANHHVEREGALAQALRGAAELVAGAGRPLALVGVEPRRDRSRLSAGSCRWRPGGPRAAGAVARFHDRPTPAQAAASSAQGALLFTGLFAARGAALARAGRAPAAGDRAAAGGRHASRCPRSTGRSPAASSPSPLFEASPASLTVINAGHCGLCDLGTPERVTHCLARLDGGPEWPAPANGLDLRRQVAAALAS